MVKVKNSILELLSSFIYKKILVYFKKNLDLHCIVAIGQVQIITSCISCSLDQIRFSRIVSFGSLYFFSISLSSNEYFCFELQIKFSKE